ncbi:hypothetical protein [Phenylobacterium sp.]|jgi:hypothetical protein|uniref:hypothetical protein n=1 Tax=Phenylobacterium sp. TaxID=1871053 RepID=UPI002F95D6F3
MAGISGSQAFGSGFRLLGREPLAVLAWTLAYFILGVMPQLGMYAAVLPDLLQIMGGAKDGSDPTMADMMALNAKMPMLQLVSMLASLVSSSVLLGAVYRAVLEPENRRFLYLRLGVQELWIGLSLVVIYVLMVLALLVAAIPVAIVAFIARSAGGGMALVLVGLLVLALFGWLAIRLSLATPMAFTRRTFVVFESWGRTQGHALKIFLVYLALFALIAAVELALALSVRGVLKSAVASGAMEGFFADPMAALADAWPMVAAIVAAGSALGVIIMVLLAAPLADIHRQLPAEDQPVV